MKILIIGIEGSGGWMKTTDNNSGNIFAFIDTFGELANSDSDTQKWIENNCEIYDDVNEAVDKFNPDLVSVCVPNFIKNDTQMELNFIEKRIPLMISKLRLQDKKDFYTLLESAKKNKTEVYIGEFYRYIPCVETVKSILNSGAIGIPEQIRYDCGLPYSKISPWEHNYKHLSLEDLAFHHFSVLHYLIDLTPKSVTGESYSPAKGGGIGGTVSSVLIITESNCRISHNIDWHNTMRDTSFLGDFYIDGTLGGVSVENERVYTMKWGEQKKEVPVEPASKSTAPEKFIAGKFDEIWTIQDFKPVIDCIYSAIGE